ncbi:MAG: ankyrin repeat domain-containing protein, partial [Bacteroidota bacterium]
MRTLILLGLLAYAGNLLATALPGKTEPNVEVLNSKSLHQAVASGEYAMVKDLLRAGADPNALDEQGRTPLDYALDNMLVYLDEHMATIGADALHLKVFSEPLVNATQIVEVLVSVGAKSERIQPEHDWILTADKRTAFPYILRQRQPTFLQALSRQPDGKYGQLEDELVEAVIDGNTRKVVRMLDNGKVSINDASSGCPITFLAALQEHTDMLKTLADRGAALDHFCELVDTDYFDRSTPGTTNLATYEMAAPLMVSINQQHVAGVAVLLRAGADVNQTCSKKRYFANAMVDQGLMDSMQED